MLTAAGVQLDADAAESNKPSVKLKPSAKPTGSASVPVASMDAAPRRTSDRAAGDVSGPVHVRLSGTTFLPHK